MENASKALIIAGSILLSILIIALGMYIFSSSSSVTDDSTLSSMQTSTFNGKFNKYTGYQNGANVDALIDALIGNCNGTESKSELPNVAFLDNGATTIATATSTKDAANMSAFSDYNSSKSKNADLKVAFKLIKARLESSHRYYVTMGTSNETDLVHGIKIEYKKDQTKTTAEDLANK